MMMKIVRTKSDKKQTLGRLRIINNSGLIFVCFSLELPDKGNRKNISRIPSGQYKVKKRWSFRHKTHLHILDVRNRTWILIHAGNFYRDIKGCILVGDELKDINNDGLKDVVNSKKTLKKILKILPKQFELFIYDEK